MTGTSNFKNIILKCSPQIRKHIMKDNDGYIYAALSRCKSFVHFFLPHCFNCLKFNHFSVEYPDKVMPATCGKRAERHKTKDCKRNFKHNDFSHECPAKVNARAFVIRKTDFDGKNKRLTKLGKIFFILSLLNVHSVRGKCFHVFI